MSSLTTAGSKARYFITLSTANKISGQPHDCSVQSRYNLPSGTDVMYKLKIVESSIISSATATDIYIRSSSFSQPTSHQTITGTTNDVIGKLTPRVFNGSNVLYYADAKSSPTYIVSSPQLNQPISLRVTNGAGTLLTSVGDYTITLRLEPV